MSLKSSFARILLVIAVLTATINTTNAEKHALLIGIDNYRYMDNLAGQKDDVYAIKKLLINSRGFKAQHITTLLDDQATAQAIKHAFLQLQQITQTGDTILVYFAGHGHQIVDKNGDEQDDGKDETLLAYDVSYNGNTGAPAEGYLTNTITDDQLKQWLDALHDRKIEVIVDACYSGTITRTAKSLLPADHVPVALAKKPLQIRHAQQQNLVLPITNKQLPNLSNTTSKTTTLISATPNRKVWTAASANELAFVDIRDADNPKSVFTHAYIEGFAEKKADRNGDNRVTDSELLRYIEDASREYCQYLQQPNRGQTCASLTPTLEVID